MLTQLLAIGASAITAGFVTHLVVPLAAKLALGVRALDYPGGRHQHDAAIPRTGGFAILAGVITAACACTIADWIHIGPHTTLRMLFALTLGCSLVALVGMVDDLVGVSAWRKLLVELLAAFVLVKGGWTFSVIWIPGVGTISLGWFGAAISMIWIAGVTNAINLLDGLDGLAAGVVAIIAGSFVCFGAMRGDLLGMIVMSAVAGACLGFLRYNSAPAEVYMGDCGALTLGFLLAAMSVRSALKAETAAAILVPVLALGLPVIDTLLVMGVRFAQRPKGVIASRFLGMFHADRNHLHHLLLKYRGSRTRVVSWIYGTVFLFCTGAVLAAVTQNLAFGVSLLVVEIAAVALMRRLGMRASAVALASAQRAAIRRELLDSTPQASDPRPSEGSLHPLPQPQGDSNSDDIGFTRADPQFRAVRQLVRYAARAIRGEYDAITGLGAACERIADEDVSGPYLTVGLSVLSSAAAKRGFGQDAVPPLLRGTAQAARRDGIERVATLAGLVRTAQSWNAPPEQTVLLGDAAILARLYEDFGAYAGTHWLAGIPGDAPGSTVGQWLGDGEEAGPPRLVALGARTEPLLRRSTLMTIAGHRWRVPTEELLLVLMATKVGNPLSNPSASIWPHLAIAIKGWQKRVRAEAVLALALDLGIDTDVRAGLMICRHLFPEVSKWVNERTIGVSSTARLMSLPLTARRLFSASLHPPTSWASTQRGDWVPTLRSPGP